jgi:aldose 1-epimerase
MQIQKEFYGATQSGTPVDLYTLTNDNGVEVKITNYGGIITSIKAPDRDGSIGEITLGMDSLEGYLGPHPFFGALVGRYGNRIRAGKFTLNGKEYQLATNANGHHLHGGNKGFDKVVWEAKTASVEDGVSLTLNYVSKDGEENYPGNLSVTVTYTLTNDDELQIDYSATTDQPTVLNLTNHTYFNLAQSETILDHVMMLEADAFTVVDEDVITTGEIRSVEGTPLDFRQPTRIGERIEADDEQLEFAGGYDHNWVVNGEPGELRLAARVTEPTTGRTLEVYTTQPGIQFYAGNMMPKEMAGRGGQTYKWRGGLCLETQHFPDSPNHPDFPSTELKPGEKYHEVTVFKFGAE